MTTPAEATDPTAAREFASDEDAESKSVDDGIDRAEADATDATNATEASKADVDALERRVASVEAELDAVRALLGGVDAVDDAVERRASIALAKVESLERELEPADDGLVRERLEGTSERPQRPARDAADGAPARAEESAAAAEPEPGRSDGDSGSLATRLRDALQ
ncbi:DUF7310 family coiled-coil domain-containing protein [Halobellus rufus]|uniref:DUF7310 family coiled-coil domain-containing protein n=1 Tax=Halobellus rufus TaxID=1448860 RepID=UPI000678AE45|nr:hypothetical protein [Halobellus rufus]